MKRVRIALVAAMFHPELIEEMIAIATQEITTGGGEVASVIKIPGSYEAPLAVQQLLKKKKVAAVIVLGYIEKGETLNGEVLGHVVNEKLVQLQLDYSKPVGIGIIGPGATLEQAKVRTEHAATAAAQAVLKMLHILKEV